MANEIKDLKGFMGAVMNELLHSDKFLPDLPILFYRRSEMLLSGRINEADYIKQWSEHGIS